MTLAVFVDKEFVAQAERSQPLLISVVGKLARPYVRRALNRLPEMIAAPLEAVATRMLTPPLGEHSARAIVKAEPLVQIDCAVRDSASRLRTVVGLAVAEYDWVRMAVQATSVADVRIDVTHRGAAPLLPAGIGASVRANGENGSKVARCQGAYGTVVVGLRWGTDDDALVTLLDAVEGRNVSTTWCMGPPPWDVEVWFGGAADSRLERGGV